MTDKERALDQKAARATVLLNLEGIEFANSGHRDVAVKRLTDCVLSFNDAIAAERERCAVLCEEKSKLAATVDSQLTRGIATGAKECAAAIRALGEEK